MPHPKAQSIADDAFQQMEESRKWMDSVYYGELAECYRNLKCRVLPAKDKNGNEIKNRTNVALPDHFVMRRKKTARLTARTPNLRVTGGRDQTQRDQIAALNYWQWDRSGSQQVFRQVVDQCVAFGWSVEKDWWNKAQVVKRFRYRTDRLTRTQYNQLRGVPQDETDGELDAYGEALTEQDIANAISEYGSEVSLPVPTTKYEGPMGQCVFIGDIFVEPGFRSLQSSCFVVEASEWDSNRLLYWSKLEIEDPETGEKRPALYPDAIQQMIDSGGSQSSRDEEAKQSLRQQLREAISQSAPRLDSKLRGKRYRILERHSVQEDGRIYIDWVSEDAKVHLGRMTYPWDTYGQYIYNELVLMPDILGGIGDSSPRISRFLMQLRNTRANQVTDFINKKLRPVFTEIDTADIPDAAYERTGWTAVKVKNHDDVRVLVDPQFPPEAWQDQAFLVREMQQVEPTSSDFASGTEAIPQAGKLATTAIFQQRSADTLINDELKQIDFFLADVLNLRLAMTQQVMQEPIDIQPNTVERLDAMMQRQGGVRAIHIDPLEIQEDLHIVPETGSTLAADDEFKKQSLLNGFQLAAQNPDVLDKRVFAEALVQTMPGVDASRAIVPPPPPQQGPDVKINVSVAVKFTELPTDAKVAIFSGAGLPVQGLQAQGLLELPIRTHEAADAAAQLEQPPSSPEATGEGQSKPRMPKPDSGE